MGNNSIPKFIFRLSRFPVYRGSVLGRLYCIWSDIWIAKLHSMHFLPLSFNFLLINPNILFTPYKLKLFLLILRLKTAQFISKKNRKLVKVRGCTYSGPGLRSRYSDLLRAGPSWDGIPLEARFSVRSRQALGTTQLLVKRVLGLFLGGKADGT